MLELHPVAAGAQFGQCAILQHSTSPRFLEDGLSEEAQALYCRPLKSASQARHAPQAGRRSSRPTVTGILINHHPFFLSGRSFRSKRRLHKDRD